VTPGCSPNVPRHEPLSEGTHDGGTARRGARRGAFTSGPNAATRLRYSPPSRDIRIAGDMSQHGWHDDSRRLAGIDPNVVLTGRRSSSPRRPAARTAGSPAIARANG
jgi:hypothetical protein